MARINIPLDALTSRLNLSGRFDSVRSQSIANRFANLKPISEFLNIKAMSKPANFGEAQNRVNYNLSHFSSNYAVVFVMLGLYSLLTNLLLLFVIILVVGGMFGISKLDGRDLDVGFLRATPSQLYTGLLVVAVPLGLWASPITTVLWLIGASMLLSPKRRFRSVGRALSSPYDYDTGRPPGALREGSGSGAAYNRRRRGYEDEWELRQAARFQERFEDLGSEDEGVLLDPRGYAASRYPRAAYVSDELYFDGNDIGKARQQPSRRPAYDDMEYEEDYDSEDAYNRRDREDALVQSALRTIAQARANGKTNVNLTQEEMQALERRQGGQPPEPAPPPVLASPPATPAKTPKNKASGSRSNSSTNLTNQKGRRKTGLFGGQSSPSPAKSNSKAKVDRNPAAEQTPYSGGAGPPGIMVPGPNGVPIFAPLVNYPPPSPEYSRAGSARQRSRSNSKHSRRESTPPDRIDPYVAYPPRGYYGATGGMRPASSSSNRSLQDDLDWYPPPPSGRKRSTSNANYARPGDDYDLPPVMPAAQGRRNVSGPAGDVRFAGLRRTPPSSSPLAPRPSAHHASSDPTFGGGRKSSNLGQELERTSSSSSEDAGVQVNIVPDARGTGYSINRAPAPALAPAPVEGRRRKGGRR